MIWTNLFEITGIGEDERWRYVDTREEGLARVRAWWAEHGGAGR